MEFMVFAEVELGMFKFGPPKSVQDFKNGKQNGN
jgi:hypothetical protein